MPKYETVTIVGVGLIGGSIGLALKQRRLAREVVGVGRRESSLSAALDVGAIDRGTTDLGEGVSQAERIVICAPVAAIAELTSQAAAACPANAIITDAGSSKSVIVAEVEAALESGAGPQFVGSHPLAGDHRTGAAHAQADLLSGRVVVVTPTPATAPLALRDVADFWTELGAEVMEMSPAEHDEGVAATSHLPHLLAFALAAATPSHLGPLAASGWRDTTRVAAADPELWQQIFTSNAAAIAAALERFDSSLAELRQAVARGDTRQLVKLLQQANRNRDALGS